MPGHLASRSVTPSLVTYNIQYTFFFTMYTMTSIAYDKMMVKVTA